ncbi:MAG: alpha/beta fold hydrolase [Pseudomonadales bacterium]
MAYLDRDGVRIFYEATGSGPTVLLSHGYSGTGHMWQGQVAALADRYQVVVWDIRGHGRSDSPTDPACYTEAHTLADMQAILDAVGAQTAVIGGLSLGGYLSLAFHVKHPERVHSLMLFDTGPGFRKAEGREGWNEMARGRARYFRRRGIDSLEGQFEAHGGLHRSAEGLALAAEGILPQADSTVIDSLPGISVPTLVLVGADDKAFLGATDYMASRIPGAVKVILEGAGHVANIDQPERFNQAVGRFLEGVFPAGASRPAD